MNIPNLEHDAFFPKGTASKVSDSFPKGLENFCFDNKTVWCSDSPRNKCGSKWPIFHSPVILLHTSCMLKSVSLNVMHRDNESLHTCDISLFQRELPIFLRKSPYQNFRISFYIVYISLFGILDLPIKFWEFPSMFNHSPYLKKKISLFVISNVSVWTVSVIDLIISVSHSDLYFKVQ